LKQKRAGYFGKENWGENGKTIQEWTGIMGYTKDTRPIVGEAPGQGGFGFVLGSMGMTVFFLL
jgi:hypothetical protein